jgi:hypothetical protein
MWPYQNTVSGQTSDERRRPGGCQRRSCLYGHLPAVVNDGKRPIAYGCLPDRQSARHITAPVDFGSTSIAFANQDVYIFYKMRYDPPNSV